MYYTGGRLLYETIYTNLKNSVPSISTLNRYLESTRSTNNLQEDDFDFEGLSQYLEERNLPKLVWISEDATRIKGKIEYDALSNKILGFVLPLKNGLPEKNHYIASSAKVIEGYFKNGTKSSYAYIVMAQPLSPGTPSFCLSILGTDNKFTYHDILNKWKYLESSAEKVGVKIVGYSSDGDSRLLKAMQIKSNFPVLDPESAKIETEPLPWFHMNINVHDIICFQDFVHILTKLRTRFLKPGVVLPIGNKKASVDHLRYMLENTRKDEHRLTLSDINAEDKMNFNSAQKMCSTSVMNCLKNIPDTEGTLIYLKIMNNLIAAFLDNQLSLYDRVYKLWFVVFLSRIWRASIKKSTEFTVTNNFLTLNCYTCVELNAHMLIKLIILLKSKKIETLTPDMLNLSNMSSQTCEKQFRMIRSMSSTYSTVVNFSIKDCLLRMRRIRIINNIVNEVSNNFAFPREQKKADILKLVETVSDEVIQNLNIKECIESCLKEALQLN